MMQFSPAIMFNQKKFTTEDLVKLNKIHKQKKQLTQDIKSLENEFQRITDSMKQHGCIIDGRIEDPKTRFKRLGKNKFNNSPEKGIQYLIENKVITDSPKEVAKFLLNPSLNKKAVGDYLGNISNHFNCEVLHFYIQNYDFTGIGFIESIRLFLSGFHLPGESQKIDKIIMAWSRAYHEQNEGIFCTESESYLMTYAVIMLNTCLHNPTAKKINGGFGREQDFLEIMRKADSNIDLNFVKSIFKSIKADPLSCMHKRKVDNVANRLENVEISGWLWKLGGRVKSWKRRWFVLSDHNLLYFVNPESHSMKGLISLQNVFISPSSNDKKFPFCFELCSSKSTKVKGCKNDNSGKTVMGRHSTYKICCPSQIDLKNWTDAIQRSINTIWQLELLQDID